MRLAIALSCVLAACGSNKPAPPATLAHLITPEVTSVMRTSIKGFPVLAYVNQLVDPAQGCWSQLVDRVTAAYQILVPGDSYFVVEGNIPRDDLEKCVPLTFPLHPETTDDDGMLAVDFKSVGKVHAAWRGPFVVIGKRHQVVAALAEHDAATVARWEKLTPPPGGEMALASTDVSYGSLYGSDATDWFLSLDKTTREPLFMSGVFKVRYKTAADAAKAADYIKGWSRDGKFPLLVSDDPDITAAYDGFAAAIGKLTPKVTGNELVIAFDSDRLGGPLFFSGVAAHFDKLQGKLLQK